VLCYCRLLVVFEALKGMAAISASCGCKGVRTCFACEQVASLVSRPVASSVRRRAADAERAISFNWCPECQACIVNQSHLPSDWTTEVSVHVKSGHRMLVVRRSSAYTFCSDGYPFRGDVVEALNGQSTQLTSIADKICSKPLDMDAELYGRAALLSSCFTGAHLFSEFLDESQEVAFIDDMQRRDWKPSQSGRRKLDFGPSVNFKRKKVKLADSFKGLPGVVRPYVDSLLSDKSTSTVLRNFVPVECGVIEYDPIAGAAIERHFDDTWLWGERLVTLSLAAAATMTFSLDCSDESHALARVGAAFQTLASELSSTSKAGPRTSKVAKTSQADCIEKVIEESAYGEVSSGSGGGGGDGDVSFSASKPLVEVRVVLPARSVLVIEGAAREAWEHAIHRDDINATRTSITLRELTPEFLPGGARAAEGAAMVARAATYLG